MESLPIVVIEAVVVGPGVDGFGFRGFADVADDGVEIGGLVGGLRALEREREVFQMEGSGGAKRGMGEDVGAGLPPIAEVATRAGLVAKVGDLDGGDVGIDCGERRAGRGGELGEGLRESGRAAGFLLGADLGEGLAESGEFGGGGFGGCSGVRDDERCGKSRDENAREHWW